MKRIPATFLALVLAFVMAFLGAAQVFADSLNTYVS